ncbi:MAG: glycosyltransferase family 4 protein [Candidatus Gastranaerophilales bacterium]|nr:glycosyltransferase family 4 protein [Candidatus Gastranaerophilales bacterium]
MKKIAFIIKLFQSNSFHGGGEKLFYNIINNFAKDGNLVDIYCSKSDVDNLQGINKIIVIDKIYDHTEPETMEIFYDEIKKLVSNSEYDYIISENITPSIDITFLQGHSLVHRQRKLKNLFESFLYNFRSVKKKRIKYQQKWLQEGYRKIFVVSNVLKNDIITNFNIPEDKISVVYPGVNVSCEFKPEFKEKDHIVFGLSAPGFKIKGGYILLKALYLLKNKGYKFKARIIYPKFKKNLWVKFLVKLYKIENNVEFLPLQKDMKSFYDSIDCVVIPSLEDTFGLVALEGMSYGKPCIASLNAGASEIIQEGCNGFIFKLDKNAFKNFAEKMMFFMDNKEDHEKYSKKSIETAKFYSWDKTYKDLLAQLSVL